MVSEVSAIVPRLNKKKNSAWSKCCYTKDEDNSPEKKREIEKKKKILKIYTTGTDEKRCYFRGIFQRWGERKLDVVHVAFSSGASSPLSLHYNTKT